MEQKTKFILIGAAGLVLILLIFLVQASSGKQGIINENQNLKSKLGELSVQLKNMDNELRNSRNKVDSLNSDISRATQARQDAEARLEAANREKQALNEKISQLQQQPQQQPQQQAERTFVPATNDEYWAGILKKKQDLELQLDSIRNELRSLKSANDRLMREKGALELEITNLTNDREEIKRQTEYNQKVTDGITQELVRERNDKMRILNNMKSMKAENAALMRQLKSVNAKRAELEKKIDGMQDENAGFQRKFGEMETMLSDRMSQIDSLKGKLDVAASSGAAPAMDAQAPRKAAVELPPIVVRPQTEKASVKQDAPASSIPTGKILAINRENSFVVINMGQDTGINAGDAMRVYRDDKEIARLEVIQVRREISACDIKSESQPIKIGDTVR